MNSDAQIMMTTDRPVFSPYWIMTSSCFFIYFCSDRKYRPVLDMLIIQQTDLFLQCFTYLSMSRYLLGNSRPAIIYLQQNVAPFLQLMMKSCVSFPLLFKPKKKIPSMGLFHLKFRIKEFLTYLVQFVSYVLNSLIVIFFCYR